MSATLKAAAQIIYGYSTENGKQIRFLYLRAYRGKDASLSPQSAANARRYGRRLSGFRGQNRAAEFAQPLHQARHQSAADGRRAEGDTLWELRLVVEELVRYLSDCGVQANATVDGEGTVSRADALTIFTVLYEVTEALLQRLLPNPEAY